MKRYIGISILFFLVIVIPCPAEDLERVKGEEAVDIVRMVSQMLQVFETFTLEVEKKTVDEEFFGEEVVTNGVIKWKRPMSIRWTETNPEDDKVESVAVLNPEKYYNYVPELNLVEILDVKENKDAEEGFKEYLKILEGGYKVLTEKYTFLVYKVKQEDKAPEQEEKPDMKPKEKDRKPEDTKADAENKEDKKSVMMQWKEKCREFRKEYNTSPGLYRIKFKPNTEELKKNLIHINFTIDEKTVLSKITVVKAGGEVTHTFIKKISDVNKPFKDDTFTFNIPKNTKVKKLLED